MMKGGDIMSLEFWSINNFDFDHVQLNKVSCDICDYLPCLDCDGICVKYMPENE